MIKYWRKSQGYEAVGVSVSSYESYQENNLYQQK